jgi:hypothetical protein
MLKIFSTSTIILVAAALVFGQATVDIPLSASDGSATIALAVGLDMTATNGIDPQLGESDLPPFPPAGVFEIRFDLTAYAGEPLSSYRDYRNAPSFPFTDTLEHTLIWQRSAAGLPINITYNIPLNATMRIQDQFGGVLLNLGPLTGSGTATIPGSLPITAAFVFMGYTDVTPVELTSFTGTVLHNAVQLNWTTATELNNQGFEIEKRTENNWEKIGYVPGSGSTTETKSYSFLDENVTSGTYGYRLKQLDFDGSFSYSNEIEVVVDLVPGNFNLSQNYPNPFNPTTSIQFQVPNQSDVSIIVYDMLGQQVKSLFAGQVQAGTYTVQWDGSNNSGLKMSSGSYIYRMTAGEFIETKEMILLK